MGIIWTNVLQELSNSQPAGHLRTNRHGKIVFRGLFTRTSHAIYCIISSYGTFTLHSTGAGNGNGTGALKMGFCMLCRTVHTALGQVTGMETGKW